MSIDELKALSRNRWMITILAQFAGRNGQRHAVILGALPIGRDSLSRTLEAAVKAGWIKRNPGHGHPLRPEYLLTETGAGYATACAAIMQAQAECGITPGTLGRWALPILASIPHAKGRFNAIERMLGDATPRAIVQAIEVLIRTELVERVVGGGDMRLPVYRVTERGRVLNCV